MGTAERRVIKSFQDRGWWTKIRKGEEIIAYKPQSGKMFYGNLTQLGNNKDDIPTDAVSANSGQ